jgi:hypothetical protein
MGRFETKWLAAEKNLSVLADLSGQWIDRVHDRRPRLPLIEKGASALKPLRYVSLPSDRKFQVLFLFGGGI